MAMPVKHGAPLAPRECEVIRLLAEGRSNKDIAASLGLTEATVRTYVSRILDKLGMSNRTEIAVWFARLGEPLKTEVLK